MSSVSCREFRRLRECVRRSETGQHKSVSEFFWRKQAMVDIREQERENQIRSVKKRRYRPASALIVLDLKRGAHSDFMQFV